MEVCSSDPSAAGVRDASIIALLYACGLRRAKLSSLDVESYDPNTGAIVVCGKGNRQRGVFVDNGAKDALDDWLLVLGESSGPLFAPITRGDRVLQGRRLSNQSVYDTLKRRARQTNVRDIRCHDLRRSFISDLLDAGGDISVAAKLAGHSLEVAARYDRRGDQAKRKAVALLHVPYRRRETLNAATSRCGLAGATEDGMDGAT